MTVRRRALEIGSQAGVFRHIGESFLGGKVEIFRTLGGFEDLVETVEGLRKDFLFQAVFLGTCLVDSSSDHEIPFGNQERRRPFSTVGWNQFGCGTLRTISSVIRFATSGVSSSIRAAALR